MNIAIGIIKKSTGGGAINQDNKPRVKTILYDGEPSLAIFADAINSQQLYTVDQTDVQSYAMVQTQSGLLTFLVHQIELEGLGKGTYGTGGAITVQASQIRVKSVSSVTTSNIESLANTQTIVLGEISDTDIVDALDAFPLTAIQDPEIGFVLIKTTRDGASFDYVFTGPGGNYGVGGDPAEASYFKLIPNVPIAETPVLLKGVLIDETTFNQDYSTTPYVPSMSSIYIDLDTGINYRWDGYEYVEFTETPDISRVLTKGSSWYSDDYWSFIRFGNIKSAAERYFNMTFWDSLTKKRGGFNVSSSGFSGNTRNKINGTNAHVQFIDGDFFISRSTITPTADPHIDNIEFSTEYKAHMPTIPSGQVYLPAPEDDGIKTLTANIDGVPTPKNGDHISVPQIELIGDNWTTDDLFAFEIDGDEYMLSQNGRNCICKNSLPTTLEVRGVVASYLKFDADVIFTEATGRTLVLVDGIASMNGAQGSTASITSVGTTDFLRISNA